MKVTVCFGEVRVVVPCGDGEILVRDLIRQATLRYKKATGKSGDSWVVVHNLQSQSDGGILDPDDRLTDVADDREQIIANYEDGDGHHHGGGDGASGSSVGTGSPDIFQSDHKYPSFPRTDIEVTGEQIASLTAPCLQVRRGSEPALNQLAVPGGTHVRMGNGVTVGPDPTKRWSATPIIVDGLMEVKETRPTRKDGPRTGYLAPDWTGREHPEREPTFTRYGSNRLSMQFLGDGGTGHRWADAAASVVASTARVQSKSLPRDHRRKEPLGQANSGSPVPSLRHDSDLEEDRESVEFVALPNDGGPLGIHVVPDYDTRGRDRGLLVQGIEPGGRIDKDGRLTVYDRIVEINGQNLLNLPFQRVQEIFKDSLHGSELQLRVVKHRSSQAPGSSSGKKPPPPVFPRSQQRGADETGGMVEGEERLVSLSAKVATVSPTKKVSPSHPSARAGNTLLAANTRKIGRKIELELTKGGHGLGFSITTRDNPAGGNCPIYIKNILPKGAAVEDGRLRPGDRLLEVNGVEMTGKTQSEAVAVLRNAPQNSRVSIVVSRQEEASTSPKLPRQILTSDGAPNTSTPLGNGRPAEHDAGSRENLADRTSHFSEPLEKVNEDGVFPWKHREIMTFDIPVHDTEKAGLGVSVKGKTSAGHNASSQNVSMTSVDLGIFVKSVLHGGAASRDGRLRTNDQLLNVNGVSLLSQTNSDAMEILRRAMLHTEGPIPGMISLTIARRASSPGSNGHQPLSGRDSATSSSGTETLLGGTRSESDAYTPDNSGTSENSDNTVIFLPFKGQDSPGIPSVKQSLPSRNPVIDRLTGQIPNQNALRNESYYRATHDTWNTTMLMKSCSPDSKTGSPTVNLPSGEMLLIEEEYVPAPYQQRMTDKVPVPKRSRPDLDGRAGRRKVEPPSDTGSETQPTDATYASQLSLEEAAGFSRDAFGRQSMSEKRHATLDAKHTDTYQRNKKLREERERQRSMQFQQEQLNDRKRLESKSSAEGSDPRLRNEFGPSLGMKKSSSLESLQTMVQEMQMQEDADPAYTYRNAQGVVRVVRGRGCNESFRAAVDRSYEAPLAELRHRIEMETLAEEETGGVPIDCGPPEGFNTVRGGPRQSSLNVALDSKNKTKKKPGLFRGIGSMFRFGKHRKTLDSPMVLGVEEITEDGEREAARRAAQEEQQRIQEQYRRLMYRQRQMENQNCNDHGSSNGSSEGGSSHQGGPSPVGVHHHHHDRDGSNTSSSSSQPCVPQGANLGPQSRTERIHELRAQHQRRHAERRGQYPMEEREERYEDIIRQRLEGPDPGRSASYDLYGEMTRPGSRVGITDPARFSHYVNYEEIQQHLNRRQQHYHSQRRDNRESQQRPVSNFYEYESVQAVMRANQQRGGVLAMDANSLPRRGQQEKNHVGNAYHAPQQRPYQPNTAFKSINNNVGARTGMVGSHSHEHGSFPLVHNLNRGKATNLAGGRPQGPFVTHVTIGHHQPKV